MRCTDSSGSVLSRLSGSGWRHGTREPISPEIVLYSPWARAENAGETDDPGRGHNLRWERASSDSISS